MICSTTKHTRTQTLSLSLLNSSFSGKKNGLLSATDFLRLNSSLSFLSFSFTLVLCSFTQKSKSSPMSSNSRREKKNMIEIPPSNHSYHWYSIFIVYCVTKTINRFCIQTWHFVNSQFLLLFVCFFPLQFMFNCLPNGMVMGVK